MRPFRRTGCAVIVLCALAALAAGPVQDVPPAPPRRIALPAAPQTRRFAVPVLMYHRVCELTAREARSPLIRDLTVSPAAFEEQIRYLAENGFAFLTAREVEDAVREGRPLPEKAVAVTLDDGYQDNFEQAYPILRRYGAAATIFLVTGTVSTPGHLSWQEVEAMLPWSVRYGSHTVHHHDLPLLSLPQMDYELRESKRLLEQRLGQPVPDLAYPSGRYSRTVVARVEAAGYRACWKKGGGPVEPHADPYVLPRIRVQGHTTLADFKRKVWSGVVVRQMRDAQRMAAGRRARSRRGA